jgi:hypothetical protein
MPTDMEAPSIQVCERSGCLAFPPSPTPASPRFSGVLSRSECFELCHELDENFFSAFTEPTNEETAFFPDNCFCFDLEVADDPIECSRCTGEGFGFDTIFETPFDCTTIPENPFC